MAKVSVHLLTWNGAKYLPFLFDSLRKQTFTDWELLVLDNGSEDATVEILEKELATLRAPHTFIRNEKNAGFTGGHNTLFKQSKSQYALIINQDLYLDANCLEKLAGFLDMHEDTVAVSPRLMQWHFHYMETHTKNMDGNFEDIFSSVVDSLGLKLYRNRRVVDLEQGALWPKISAKYASPQLGVFGISGACAMYRMEVLQRIAFADGSVFDTTYFAYKEDVDVAYRLQSRGGHVYVLLDTVAWHDRTAAGNGALSDTAAAKNKTTQSTLVKMLSYKNQLATLYKNETWQNLTLDFFWILWYEGKKLVWLLLFDRPVLGALRELWQERKALKQKRIHVRRQQKVGWKSLRIWLT